jgi:hypothetical protein
VVDEIFWLSQEDAFACRMPEHCLANVEIARTANRIWAINLNPLKYQLIEYCESYWQDSHWKSGIFRQFLMKISQKRVIYVLPKSSHSSEISPNKLKLYLDNLGQEETS